MRKKLIAIQCLSFSDIGMALLTYFSLSNFEDFKRILKIAVPEDSPEFQIEIYKMFLQTLIFITFLFVILHLVIYYFFYKGKKFATSYVKFYSLLAGFSLIASAVYLKQYLLIVPSFLYFTSFYHAKN